MKKEVKPLNFWSPPEGGGAPLLTMPNVPFPLHKLAPRTIMGDYEWGKVRKKCYADAGDVCEISGEKLGSKRGDRNLHAAHEVYAYDFASYTATFMRPICVSPLMHNFIHSGRAITCYRNHEKLWDKEYMLTIAEAGFKLISDWNKQHPDDEPLRAYEVLLGWLEEPSLEREMEELIDKYNIEFWGAPRRKDWDNAWGKWKLIYNGTEYYSPYQSQEDWEKEVTRQHEAPTSLFAGDEFEELRKNIGG